MVMLKNKGVKPKFNPEEPTSSGGDNTDSNQFSSPEEDGKHNDNVGGIVRVSDSSSIKLLCDGRGNMADEVDDHGEFISDLPLLVATPRLVELFAS